MMHAPLSPLAIAGALLALTAPLNAGGETITVTTLNDVTDFGGAQQVADLPGPDGVVSFREACTAANNTAGPQTIEFAIPQSEWWLGGNDAVLRLEDGPFSLNDDETTVDFTTQTDFTGDTNPNGWEVGIYGLQPNAWGVAAIFVNGDNCVIKGLGRVMQRGYGVEVTGNNNRVISCIISGPLYAGVIVQGWPGDPATGNIVGGTTPEERNILSAGNAGIRVDGPTDNTVVIGNTLVGSPFGGVEVRGAYCCPDYTPFNTRIGGPTPEEANWIADNGKFGEEGFPLGDQVQVEYAVNTIVEGNIIGTTQDGSERFPNAHGTVGVGIRESENTIVRNNLIAGIIKEGVNHHDGEFYGTGVRVYGPDAGVVIEGNRIGTDATGNNPIPNLIGISFDWFQGNPTGGQIGGENGAGNIIAFNETRGVIIGTGVNGVTISGNSIHSNGALGIDLVVQGSPGTGVTPNDAGDGDTGGNNLQNFPVITSANATGSSITIEGTLNSVPNQSYTIEFFANQECDPSGHGEGEVALGQTVATTDAIGNAAFSATLPFTPDSLTVVTATATRGATGDTSEFSACFAITFDEAMPGDLNADGQLTSEDRAMFCSSIGSSTGEPAYMAEADLNNDGVVDHLDLAMLNVLLPVCAGDVASSATFAPPADGVVDGADLAYLLGAWANQPSCADFVASRSFQPPPDGKVDGADLAFLLGAWGACD
jgi:hypothetical protein